MQNLQIQRAVPSHKYRDAAGRQEAQLSRGHVLDLDDAAVRNGFLAAAYFFFIIVSELFQAFIHVALRLAGPQIDSKEAIASVSCCQAISMLQNAPRLIFFRVHEKNTKIQSLPPAIPSACILTSHG